MAGAKSLFDHIKQITDFQNPKYWDTLSESDRKSWSNYMVLRFISMKPDWIELVSDIQPYIQELPPKTLYAALIGVLPKGKNYLKYIKGKAEDKYEKWLLELVVRYYEISIKEAEDYLKILYLTNEGKKHIKQIAEAYGTDPKLITKLKLGLK